MKYTVTDENGEYVSLEQGTEYPVILDVNNTGQFVFTMDEFKEFRKAVGYVWQEVHQDGDA